MKVDGMFRGWEIDTYHARHGPYSLWICSGFAKFADGDFPYQPNKLLLRGLSLWTRWRIWRELQKEIKRRSVSVLEALVSEASQKEDT